MLLQKKPKFNTTCFHRLSLIPLNKTCFISFDDLTFQLSNEEMILFSPHIFLHCIQTGTPFELPFLNLKSEIGAFISLFKSQTSMMITQETFSTFSSLTEKIDLSLFTKAFNNSSEPLPFGVSLALKHFLSISPKLHSLLNNFTLIVSRQEFKCNLSFICCISDKIFQQNPILSSLQLPIEIEEEKEEELNDCISRLLSFLKGKSISFKGISSKILSIVIDSLEIIKFDEFLEKKIPISKSFDESVQFLQFNFSSRLKNHFSQSIQFVSSELYKFDESNIPKFELNTFEAIFSHSTFKIKSENAFFQIVKKVIETDSSFMILLKYIHLSFIDSTMLNEFFSSIEISHMNIELFEQLKSSFLGKKKGLHPQNRWIEQSKHLSQEEIHEIVAIIENLTKAKNNLPVHLREFVDQHYRYEQSILIQNEEIKLLKQNIEKESQQSKTRFLSLETI
jgi:hypothetical protein